MQIRNSVLIEVCVDNIEDALRAEDRGADQIELCSRLDLDGLSPSSKLLDQAFTKLSIPIKPMLRLREGDFVYSRKEKDQMLQMLFTLLDYNCKSIVFGALNREGGVDTTFLDEISDNIGSHVICFHKAVDYSNDLLSACSVLASCKKVAEVLSSGGSHTALDGANNLNKMKSILRPDQKLIAAGKIRPENIGKLHKLVNLEYYHGRKIINF